MANDAKTKDKKSKAARPALSPQARENQMIALAIDEAERRLRDGTASSQVLTHYLKLGSMIERERMELMKKQQKLMDAKTEAINANKHADELYANALTAMRKYQGEDIVYDDEEYY